jgi:N-acetyl-anhydromuramyl-L-alanine amidase AmpD
MSKYTELFHSKIIGKQKKKKQIILSHTSRNIEEYLNMLKYRINGKYDKAPHFIISKDGNVIQTLPVEGYSNFFDETNVNRNSIIISFENLGWVEKVSLKNYYSNWIGDIYTGVPYEKKWRDYFFWDPYTEQQLKLGAELCKTLVREHKIEKKCIGHNTEIKDVEKLGGIVSKSNFNRNFTDLSPAFDFQKFTNYIKDEQFV